MKALLKKGVIVLMPGADGGTDVSYSSDVSITGRLGKFGLGVMRKKADQIIKQFAQNVSRELEKSNAA